MGWLRAGLWVRALSNLTSQQRCGSLSQPLMLPPLPSYLCSQTGLPLQTLATSDSLSCPQPWLCTVPHPALECAPFPFYATSGPQPTWVPGLGSLTPVPLSVPQASSTLGGLCVVWAAPPTWWAAAALRGPMQLSGWGRAAAGVGACWPPGLLWACAVGLYMGQLELGGKNWYPGMAEHSGRWA